MIFRPVFHVALLGIIAVLGAIFVFLSAKRATRRHVMDVLRRFLIVVTVIIMGAGPSIPGEAQEVTSTLEVYFVIDRTGSMAAEDWDGNNPRIDGVRNDVAIMMNALTGARFSIMSWDSKIHTDLPLTSDASAVVSYMDSFDRELSRSSQGSSVNRPAKDLAKLLKKNKERHPQNVRALFVFSDGETSNQDHWTSAPSGEASDWDAVKEYIDGGLVLGYGTEEGGPMKVLRLGDSGSQSGGKPEYIHDSSKPGNPIAISKIDEAALADVASRVGVDYVHSPDKSAIESHARSMFDKASTLAESRNLKDTYRYIIWPFALLLGGLLAWEGATLAQRAQQLRNSHAI